ncbi:MAG: Fic family protein [Candidatus Beckwithbacteria bacterium]
MKNILKSIDKKKKQLDKLKPLSKELANNLQNWLRVELTYTSNALEGNTLSRLQTALVLDKGITVDGKSLNEHLEITNHAQALDYIYTLAKKNYLLKQKDILNIHQIILSKIDDQNAGRYRSISVRIAGSRVIMPNPAKVSQLMTKFVNQTNSVKKVHPAKFAADVHYQLVSIHPFSDGNGRTARLLMNLFLIKAGYPPIIIKLRDRHAYLKSLETAQLGGSLTSYYKLIYKSLINSLDIYLSALVPNFQGSLELSGLLKIGQLAKATKETVSTIRFWTTQNLLTVSSHSKGGYQLYSPSVINQVKKIRQLQQKRYTIKEIKSRL